MDTGGGDKSEQHYNTAFEVTDHSTLHHNQYQPLPWQEYILFDCHQLQGRLQTFQNLPRVQRQVELQWLLGCGVNPDLPRPCLGTPGIT